MALLANLALGSGIAAAQVAAPAAPPVATDAADNQLGDIIVTAQRRSERLQEVPIAISAIGGELAAERGVTDLQSLNTQVPSLNVIRGNIASAIYLRGVGNSSTGTGQEPNVAIYVDGLYYPAIASDVLTLNNVERVEVLKGPQGTLFGRNTTGGVIQIVTKDPSHTLQGNFEAGYGNYNTLMGNAYVTGPLSDNLAVSLAGQYEDQRDGWGKNVSTGLDVNRAKSASLRAKAKLDISPNDTLTLSGNYFYQRSDIGAAGQVLTTVPLPFAFNFAKFTGNIYNSDAGYPAGSSNRQYDASARFNHTGSVVSVTDIAGYQVNRTWSLISGAPGKFFQQVSIPIETTSASNELQFLSPTGSRISWVAGLYLFYSNAYVHPFEVRAGPASTLVLQVYSRLKTYSYAVFGQATVPLGSDATKLTLGARYTTDRKPIDATQNALGAPLATISTHATFSEPTFRVALAHDFSPQLMVYASVNTGFKAGLYNATSPLSPPVKPEKITAYEVGMKSSLDRRLRLDLAGFYYDYRDLQVQKPTGTTTTYQNAATAKIYGAEVEVEARLVAGLTVRASGALQHSEYTSFPGAAATVLNAVGLGVQTALDVSGDQIARAPDFTGSIGADYETAVGSGRARASISYYHNSGFPWEADGRLRQWAYDLLNASVTLFSAHDRVSLQLWGRNLTATRYYTYETSANKGPDTGAAAAPRTYGVTLGAKF